MRDLAVLTPKFPLPFDRMLSMGMVDESKNGETDFGARAPRGVMLAMQGVPLPSLSMVMSSESVFHTNMPRSELLLPLDPIAELALGLRVQRKQG